MEKLYHTISETAALLGETVVTVRFWSNTFSRHLAPKRNAKGNRMFTAKDIETLKHIQYLTRDCGLSLEAAAKKMAKSNDGSDKTLLIRDSLLKIRDRLLKIRETL